MRAAWLHLPGRSSIRYRLTLTYAGIALLSVAVLGSVLVLVLDNYFRASEDAYLSAVASQTNDRLSRIATESELARETLITALTSQTRVRIYSTAGALIADSGSPTEIDPTDLAPAGDQRARSSREPLPSPLGGGIFSSADQDAPRSDRVLRTSITSADGTTIGYLLLSDGPASGHDVLVSVAQALALAAIVAVILAATAGYIVSGRISKPIVVLTETSDEMAEGNLGARNDVDRDDEVGRLASSFNTMADRIEATVTTLRRFVADAAHEIGTPLTALQADLELADGSGGAEEERVFVRRALQQARRIEDLSNNLLRLSRLEAGEAAAAHELVDLVSLLRTTTDSAASRAEQAGIDLSVHLSDTAVEVMGDGGKLQVLLDNLLDNAFKFTPFGGSVEVGVRRDEDQAVLWVSDSGIGIPVTEQPEIFSRFYRARNVSAYPGSGLGLAIVHATALGHGGTVGLHSDGEHGTRFEVRLPMAEETEA